MYKQHMQCVLLFLALVVNSDQIQILQKLHALILQLPVLIHSYIALSAS